MCLWIFFVALNRNWTYNNAHVIILQYQLGLLMSIVVLVCWSMAACAVTWKNIVIGPGGVVDISWCCKCLVVQLVSYMLYPRNRVLDIMLSLVVDLKGLTLPAAKPVFHPTPESVQVTNWKPSLVVCVITLPEFSPQTSYSYLLLSHLSYNPLSWSPS